MITDYSELSLDEIYQIILGRGLNPTTLTVDDVREFVDEYRRDWELIRDFKNIAGVRMNKGNRGGKSKGNKSKSEKARKRQFRADQVLSVIEVKK